MIAPSRADDVHAHAALHSHHTLTVLASVQKVFDALTTTEGLAGWWTTGAHAEHAHVGGELRFSFGAFFNPQMRIAELDPPRYLRWEGVAGHQPWGGARTTITFMLADGPDDSTTIRFRHDLGPDASGDAVASANFNWGYYLNSLRLCCETGTGQPFRVGDTQARVAASTIAGATA